VCCYFLSDQTLKNSTVSKKETNCRQFYKKILFQSFYFKISHLVQFLAVFLIICDIYWQFRSEHFSESKTYVFDFSGEEKKKEWINPTDLN